jgi:hypothetical protein
LELIPASLLFLVPVVLRFDETWRRLAPMAMAVGWRLAVLGIYIFAGAVSAALAFLAVFMLAMDRIRGCAAASDIEPRYQVAKLLLGFVLFWAYIALLQYLLVRYATVPAELTFYQHRSGPVWRWLTVLLVVLHFLLPFCGLISARAKRSAGALLVASLCVLAGHWVDWSWLVLPALFPHGAGVDVTSLAVVVFTELAVGAVVLSGFVRELQVHERGRSQLP